MADVVDLGADSPPSVGNARPAKRPRAQQAQNAGPAADAARADSTIDLTDDTAPLRRPVTAVRANAQRAAPRLQHSPTHGIAVGVVPPPQFKQGAAAAAPKAAPAPAAPPPPPPEPEGPACALCLDDLKGSLCTVPCGHVFHFKCMEDAFKKGFKKCPKCRKNISGQKQIKKIYLS